LGLVVFPFFLVRFVPATDLPQHLCQVKLFIEHFTHPESTKGYFINWSGANSLVYMLLGINWLLFPPLAAGKALMLELACSWVIAVFLLAKRRNRPIESAVLASILVYGTSFYWGFINFLIGFPVFIGWYIYIIDQHEERKPLKQISIVLFFSVLLFLAHALWLIIGIVCLIIDIFRRHSPILQVFFNGIALLPIVIYSAIWYMGFSAARSSLHFNIAAHWLVQPINRLNPQWLIDAILGGIHGPMELLVLISIGIWCFFALFTNRGNIRSSIDLVFLWIGVFFTAIVFLAPEQYMNTIFFASRWTPIAMTFFLLALPLPKIRDIYLTAIPLLIVTFFFCTTGLLWYEFEEHENTGLTEALDAIPDQASVLGLDCVKVSTILCGRPYLQTVAYAQLLHGSKINFSFAEHQNGIIAVNAANSWSPGLEWMAERVKGEDCQAFDYALINASMLMHDYISFLPLFKPITTNGQWRLYRCEHNVQLKGYLFMKK
jgi:hypothetical protein